MFLSWDPTVEFSQEFAIEPEPSKEILICEDCAHEIENLKPEEQ